MIGILILFSVFSFVIFWGMIGYPTSLILLNKLIKGKRIETSSDFEPTVTLLIVAHNEEKVIVEKLKNAINLNYRSDKFKIVVTSDNSTDATNELVTDFINSNLNHSIKLYKVTERKGKTNAQDEAVCEINSDIIVFTDANSILDKNSILEIVSYFFDKSVSYVTGKLTYYKEDNITNKMEASYWDFDLTMRKIESSISSCTAGNGALYACRKSEYIKVGLINSHDSAMPLHFALNNKRAVFNENAIVYEKTGDSMEDEMKRKVRMNRTIFWSIFPSIKLLNIFKNFWFSYFYFGHRTCRYLLGVSHISILVFNILLLEYHSLFIVIFVFQLLFYAFVLMKVIFNINHKFFNLCYYYFMTILAQLIAIVKKLCGKSKPFWEKSESTR